LQRATIAIRPKKTVLPPLLDRRIDEITEGLIESYGKNLRLLDDEQNISSIVDYIRTLKTETPLSDHYRKDNIHILTRFSKFHNNKPFKAVTRDDVIAFLDILRKPESVDPLHKWVGTYNQYKMYLTKFFKWLYSPHISYNTRPSPSVVENIPKQKRKEMSTYKPSDLWNQQDDLLFLKYCRSKRDRCYHTVSRDLSCRPHEILKLKIKDVAFKTIGTSG
jgi:integrase